MFDEIKYHKCVNSIGRVEIIFKAEIIPGSPLLDTEVIIPESGCLCWISYPKREEFLKELNAVIDKYQI